MKSEWDPKDRRVARAFIFQPDDIAIRSDGTGRTVEAYATVFNQPAEVVDQWGHYLEQIAPTAFNQTLTRSGQRFPVLYNHGRTLDGTPSDIGSMPIGSTSEVRPDGKGLFTVARYNSNPLADQTLEAIRNGDITGMSWRGRIYDQDVPTPRGGFRPDRSGALTVVTRTETGLRELGPTPFPTYVGADIVAVRSEDIARALREMDPDELAELLNLPAAPLDEAARDSSTTPVVPASDDPPALAAPSVRSYPADLLRQVGQIVERKIR